jgi:hypothetical protein
MAKHHSVTLYNAAREIASSGARANDRPSIGHTACATAAAAASAARAAAPAAASAAATATAGATGAVRAAGTTESGKPEHEETVGQVLMAIVRDPIGRVGRRWNWKSAVLSSASRASLFFSANLSAGLDAALAAMLTEFVFRAATAGFYGGLTQSFRHATPHWLASITVMVMLPICTHTIEFFVHWFRGTEKLAASIMVSAVFTVISTLFNLFAMRRGVLIVGEGRGSLLADLRQIPRLIVLFVASILCLSRRSI